MEAVIPSVSLIAQRAPAQNGLTRDKTQRISLQTNVEGREPKIIKGISRVAFAPFKGKRRKPPSPRVAPVIPASEPASKEDLATNVSTAAEMTENDAVTAVNTIFSEIRDFLISKGAVQIAGFGKFFVKVTSAGKAKVGFTPYKALEDAVTEAWSHLSL